MEQHQPQPLGGGQEPEAGGPDRGLDRAPEGGKPGRPQPHQRAWGRQAERAAGRQTAHASQAEGKADRKQEKGRPKEEGKRYAAEHPHDNHDDASGTDEGHQKGLGWQQKSRKNMPRRQP